MSHAAVTDSERCYRAVRSRDPRFDGVFYTAVTTTGIYCRPSCPAVTPKQANVEFYVSTAAAQVAGFRACRRCRPDATPGSPDWDVRADVAGRAMRLINDGVVERDGVAGLARRVGYTPRHLGRMLVDELGAGPLALARARRAQTARVLIETTTMPMSEVAFAAGFSSIRQFNATVNEVYACSPTGLRRARDRPSSQRARGHDGSPSDRTAGRLAIRLPVRKPFAGQELLAFLAVRAVPGVEEVSGDTYERTMRLPHGPARVRLTPREDHVECELHTADLRDVASAVERCRRLLDLDADPEAVVAHLATDALLGPLVAARPGLRVPGHVDGLEIGVRAVVGQQISVAGARTVLRRLVTWHGDDIGCFREADPEARRPSRLFPSADALAAVDPETLPMPRARGRALVALCRAVADGRVMLDRSLDRAEVRDSLLAVPGIGAWTADYLVMRSLGDPDVFLPTDVGVRHGLSMLGADPSRAAELALAWRPWRSYALLHLWASLGTMTDSAPPVSQKENR